MRSFQIFLQSILLVVALSSGSAFAGEKLLANTFQDILKICQERVDFNNEFLKNLITKYTISKNPKDKLCIDAILVDLLTLNKFKTKLHNILNTEDLIERDRLIDDLREALRRAYIEEKSEYNRRNIKASEGPYIKKMFDLIYPFISTTQKRLEVNLLAYVVKKNKKNFLTYKLDVSDRLDRLRDKAILVLNKKIIVSESLEKNFIEWIAIRNRFLEELALLSDLENFYACFHRIFTLEDDIDNAWLELENPEESQEKEYKVLSLVCNDDADADADVDAGLELECESSFSEQKPLSAAKEERRLDSFARLLKRALVKKNNPVNPGTVALAVELSPDGQTRLIIATKQKVSSKDIREAMALISNWSAEWSKLDGVCAYVVEKNSKLKWVLNNLRKIDSSHNEISLMRLYNDVRSDVDTVKLAIFLSSKSEKSEIKVALNSALNSNTVLLIDCAKGLHPELAIADYFVNSKSSQKEVYIGINILNCRKCYTLFEGEAQSKDNIRIKGINEHSGICFKRRGKFDFGYPNARLPDSCLKANPSMKHTQIYHHLDLHGPVARSLHPTDLFLCQNAELSDSDEEACEMEREMIEANRRSIASIKNILFKNKKLQAHARLVEGDGECGFSSLRTTRAQYVRDVVQAYKSGQNIRLNRLVNIMLGRRNIDQWAAWYINSGEWMTEQHLEIYSALNNTEIYVYTADTADGGIFVPLQGQGAHINETNGLNTNVAHLLFSSFAPLDSNAPITAFNHYDEIIIGENLLQNVNTNTNGLILDQNTILDTQNLCFPFDF